MSSAWGLGVLKLELHFHAWGSTAVGGGKKCVAKNHICGTKIFWRAQEVSCFSNMPPPETFIPFLRTTLTISTQRSPDGSLQHFRPENKRFILKMKTLACTTPDVNLLSITESISTSVEGDQIFNDTILPH